MATRTMIFGFIRVMVHFRKGTGKHGKLLDALVMVKLLPTLKHVINVNHQNRFTGLGMHLKVKHRLRFHLYFLFSGIVVHQL